MLHIQYKLFYVKLNKIFKYRAIQIKQEGFWHILLKIPARIKFSTHTLMSFSVLNSKWKIQDILAYRNAWSKFREYIKQGSAWSDDCLVCDTHLQGGRYLLLLQIMVVIQPGALRRRSLKTTELIWITLYIIAPVP